MLHITSSFCISSFDSFILYFFAWNYQDIFFFKFFVRFGFLLLLLSSENLSFFFVFFFFVNIYIFITNIL